MNEQTKKRILSYGDVIANIGLNIQQDEILVIQSSIDGAPLARAVTKAAYELGAKKVILEYHDEEITKMQLMYQSIDTMKEIQAYQYAERDYYIEQKVSYLLIESSAPDFLKDAPKDKLNERSQTMMKFSEPMQDEFGKLSMTWCIVAYPSIEWAQLVFPDLSETEAFDRLLEEILTNVRLNEVDPVAAWKAHVEALDKRAKWLTDKNFDALHYTAPGTDLHVGLIDGAKWLGAKSKNKKGHDVIVNMPTEEIFSSPDFRRVNGRVANTLPLSYRGNIIDDFYLDFKDGVVVNYGAEQGLETLEQLLDTDEGARRLGEIALVPVDSPISQSGVLYYSTLFDENASCHIALGDSFPEVIDASDLSTEEQLAKGLNDSLTHVDFMIGSDKLTIEGIFKDGSREKVFENGNWLQ